MIAIITGDIINSRQVSRTLWSNAIKKILRRHGKWPRDWEIYRGDSFQLACAPEDALEVAIHIKATIRQVEKLDVRMAIGIGERGTSSKRITESTGPAFERSGSCFDALGKKTLAIASPWHHFDETFNLYFGFLDLVTFRWTVSRSRLISYVIEHPKKSQKQVAKKFKKSQSTLSESFKQSGWAETHALISLYQKRILEQ